MIKAKIIRNNNNIVKFEIRGHADAGEYGSDIVCSAVSALTISIVNGLDLVVNVHPKVTSDDLNGGLMIVEIPKIIDHDKQIMANALLDTFENGLKDISHNYSDYVKLQ
ncbi:ribosomal-processing cysteine protease Prp [Apilactobacillus sp. TMW 2.2459]|uniref:ribosomal-processing cysteine protease Prp n=1 Tax=Apilactobacillus xinyiensis TaxID=2841032 RepID=UPI00200E1260|nr:ribosomal-processing cysteine protease Prp [Apilactobacillus xinyiensis]MCL0311774.1 ribosomal-processing cysteine protease Prp [Apilactobacillus xinyiensis]